MVKNASCQSILFPCYVKELSIHVHCVCLAESINKWVERMAVRGVWRPLSGLICEIVNSVGQGNFTFVREKSGNFKHLWLWQPWFHNSVAIKQLLAKKGSSTVMSLIAVFQMVANRLKSADQSHFEGFICSSEVKQSKDSIRG